MKQWLRDAFAVDPPGPAEPTDAQRPVIDTVCREVVRRGLTTPALMFLEMSRPLNYVGSQAMGFLQPIVAAVIDTRKYALFAEFLERRGSIEYLSSRLQALEQERAVPSSPSAGDAAGHESAPSDR
jgi:hypothetical protein